MNTIRIFTVGGTIDKIYFDAKSSYEVGPPNIQEVLSGINLSLDYELTSLMQKDSLDMTDEDRQLIQREVENAKEDRIIITHGTDTMVATAQQLSTLHGKTIVLTGALAPALFKSSDAMFNIGAALTAVQTMPHGIYIAMNGRVFQHDEVIKDVEQNRFMPL
ncbi:MAG: asparaginase [SAR86 cluster bacterium]|uniref:Asparaginase n=1 Tax=SAR86 cluster bacterium TaxID=2030880 RepID=A0A2A5AVX3_9GAMM|nr:MAG: asparaginase [SAR86 cluster bacterium]